MTVIIPAYNAAKRIGRTLDSVLAQTLRDILVWVVDDGSRDETADVVRGYVQRDPRVRLIQQENQGAYSARVNAWKLATTDYVGFVDADDTIEPTMYERLVAFSDEHRLEVAQCDSTGWPQVGVALELFLSADEVHEKVVVPRLVRGDGSAFVWDKLYRTGVHDIAKFEKSRVLMGDDLAINLQFFQGVSRVGYLHEPLYHYEINEGSSVRNFGDRYYSDFHEMVRFRNLCCPAFGFESDHPLMVKWILMNLMNGLKLALKANAPSFAVRVRNVKAWLAMPEVQVALKVRGGVRVEVSKLVIRVFRAMPWLAVLVVRAGLKLLK